MKSFFEDTVCKVFTSCFSNFFLLFIIERIINKTLIISFIKFFQENLRITIINRKQIFKKIKYIRILILLVNLSLNTLEKLFYHYVKTKIVIPTAYMKLLFIREANISIKLIGQMYQNVIIFINFANLPKRS